jgi:hypothetical protein
MYVYIDIRCISRLYASNMYVYTFVYKSNRSTSCLSERRILLHILIQMHAYIHAYMNVECTCLQPGSHYFRGELDAKFPPPDSTRRLCMYALMYICTHVHLTWVALLPRRTVREIPATTLDKISMHESPMAPTLSYTHSELRTVHMHVCVFVCIYV